MNSSERHRNSVTGLDVIRDKLEVSFAKAPSRAGFPHHGPSRAWAASARAAHKRAVRLKSFFFFLGIG